MVWLAMPGTSCHFHAHLFKRTPHTILRWTPSYEDYRDDVIRNWQSISREDAIRLSRERQGQGHVPLFIQMHALDDLKHMPIHAVAARYNMTLKTTERLSARKYPSTEAHKLPPEFAFLVGA